MNIHDLKTKGFVTLSYPKELRSAVNKTIDSWKKFCALPTDIKRGLPYSNNADGVGYELKDGGGNKGDRKENFDVALAGGAWLEKHAGAIKNPAVLEFVENATGLVGILKPIVLDFAQQSQDAFGMDGFIDEVAQGDDAFFVRRCRCSFVQRESFGNYVIESLLHLRLPKQEDIQRYASFSLSKHPNTIRIHTAVSKRKSLDLTTQCLITTFQSFL